MSDPSEMVELGAELANAGAKLKELKAERDRLNEEIAKLEAHVRPLTLKYSQLLVEIVGPLPQPAGEPAPVPPPTPPSLFENTTPPPQAMQTTTFAPNVQSAKPPDGLRQRVLAYLQRVKPDENLSALEIAEALHVDPVIVRQVMIEIHNTSRAAG